MLRLVIVTTVLVAASSAFADPADPDDDNYTCTCDVTPAACDAGCACDSECTVDWSADECADPAAGCQPEQPDDEATVETDETTPDDGADATPQWTAATTQVACPSGATLDAGGRCTPEPGTAAEVTGGAAASASVAAACSSRSP